MSFRTPPRRTQCAMFCALVGLCWFSTVDAHAQETSERALSFEHGRYYGELWGQYRFRMNGMGDIPLQSLEEQGFPDSLEQNYFAEQRFRLGGEFRYQDRVRTIRLVGEIDLIDGLVFGDETTGVETADISRHDLDSFTPQGVEPRYLYLEYLSPFGLFRAGLMGSQWGLGILASDGAMDPVFGDADRGDRGLRAAFATKPLGAESPLIVALAADLVFDDVIADIRDGERAFQGIFATIYQPEEGKTVGFYIVYRAQRTPFDTGELDSAGRDGKLNITGLDLYARWFWDDPRGGEIFVAAEGAAILGDTSFALSVTDIDQGNPKDKVRQYLMAAQVGRKHPKIDSVLQFGFASGDSNPEDNTQRRAVMDHNHQVGLIMFPEVLAWNTARASTLAGTEELFGRPAPGSDRFPTDGGVAGAFYLFPYVVYRPLDWLDLRLGAIWGRASSDVVDVFRQRANSESASFLGGDPGNRNLGFEVDGAVRVHLDLPHGLTFLAGLEGGVFLPGNAFDDENGRSMGTLGLVRARVGFRF